ncbi:IS110 family transposase [Streptomyces sp. RLB3-17]|uniref:IS110 family transposase n=1 Tax=unclassified Streptomyces TaxID=2593676 RepID=UPI001163E5A7|nr:MULTISPECIES: IS110 family transposase [unclassified Streptomyces]QDN96209.1 IS110 family transposase [Streptomyces sp. RLB1-9]QDO03558.1 IS110 family transposase [Streptomyces sp. RLB1-9]QDO17917.1 IS110 family transposase [Streptomyces sp. S1A1-8]QDO25289.1 IS110 family transposase [Streptomyces sp. S1A1-8]QDO28044.1 IS110 family transposase [Streptomyces sp. S1A1-3]
MCDDELAEVTVPQIWAGVDIGKEHHHCVVIDERGERLLSRRVLNDEPALLELIKDVLTLSEDALWAVDINHGGAALLIGLLLGHDQPMVYITGLAVHQASTAYRGQGKTDEKDAFVIADQARMRQDLGLLRPGDEIAVDLRTLTARRTDLVNDRTRQTNRLRAQLLEFFPALERALNLSKKGPVVLLTGYQTPAAFRRSGINRIGTWLRNRRVKNAATLAETAVGAAKSQHTALPGEKLAAAMVARIAKGVLALDEEISELDALIEARFHEHRHAAVIRSLPGMGALLGAEFIAATGGDMDPFGTADRLASFAGLSPVPRDSGRVSGNMRRPRRYHRGLLRAFYLSSMASLRTCTASQAYYARKRNEGKGHKQALLSLARRRANVLWAMIRDGACYIALPKVTAAA